MFKFFKILWAWIVGFFSKKNKPNATKASGNPFAISGRAAGGREGFMGISAPRCHTQKYKNGRKRV